MHRLGHPRRLRRAVYTAGNPCVGLSSPSDGFISRSSEEWLAAMQRVFARMTDIPAEEIDRALRSPQTGSIRLPVCRLHRQQRDPGRVL